MITTAIILFIISAILLMAACHYLLAFLKPGVYPPKQVLKGKALILGCAGAILLFIGSVVFYFL